MPSLELFQTLMGYNEALYQRLWDSILTLTDEQFLQPIPYSHGSIRNHMVHVAIADARWLRAMQALPDARTFTLDPIAYPTAHETRTLWAEGSQALIAYVASLNEEDLHHTPPGLPGPIWQVLAHVVNHNTDHRAQLLRALHDFGAPTFDQDLIMHLWMR